MTKLAQLVDMALTAVLWAVQIGVLAFFALAVVGIGIAFQF
jgi:hypothetical protein